MQREADKKALKKERQRLRAIASGGGSGARLLGDDDTEKLCATLNVAALAALCDGASAEGLSGEQRAALLAARVAELAAAEAEAAEAKERQKREAAAALQVWGGGAAAGGRRGGPGACPRCHVPAADQGAGG